MRSLVLNLSLLTARNWVPGPLAGLGGRQLGGGWVNLRNGLLQLLLWSLLSGVRGLLSSLDTTAHPHAPLLPQGSPYQKYAFLSTVDLGNLKGQPETQVR